MMELGFQGYTCNWGTDVAVLYEDEDEIMEVLAGVFHAGVLADNRQCGVFSEHLLEKFDKYYCQKYPEEVEKLSDVGCFKWVSQERAKNIFNPSDPLIVCDLMDSLYYESQAETPTSIRCILDIEQALKSYQTPQQLAELIFHINLGVCSKNWLQVTLYNLNKISALHLMYALEHHRFVMKGEKMIQNSLHSL